jgi:pimeloyl-ACP methyl ester carboxylesterase
MSKTYSQSNRIDTIESIVIGGVKQWIALRSEDTSNPMLLFLHGGPGTAQIAWSRKAQRALERDYIVINWDQRGAGRSYSSKLKAEDMLIERFVLDAEELVEALLQRFKQEKLFLVGHSWGSIVGVYLAAKRPDLFWAYVGIGQVADMARGELLSYQFTLDESKRIGNQKAIHELENIGEPPYANLKAGGIQRKWLGKFGGQTVNGTSISMLFKNITARDLGFLGIIKIIQGAMFSLKNLEEQQNRVNLFQDVTELKLPVFFCCGRRDYNVPFELAVEYLEKLKAPQKEVVWFEHSAHSPNFEEPVLFNEFCLKRLKHCAEQPFKSASISKQ